MLSNLPLVFFYYRQDLKVHIKAFDTIFDVLFTVMRLAELCSWDHDLPWRLSHNSIGNVMQSCHFQMCLKVWSGPVFWSLGA